MEALQGLEERLDLEVLKGHHLVVLRMGDLLDSGGHLALETEDLTIPLDEVDEGLVDRLEVPEGVGEVEGVLLIVHSEGVEEVPQRGALEVVEVQEVVGEVSQDHGMMDQWMVLKVVLHLLVLLGDRPHSEETTKGALAILMSKYFHDEWSIILGISLVPNLATEKVHEYE